MESDAKKSVLGKFNGDRPGRTQRPGASVQKLVYEEVPFLRVGNFNSLAARSNQLEGLTPMNWPFFWNTSLRAQPPRDISMLRVPLLARLAGAVLVLVLVAVIVFIMSRLAAGDPIALLLGDQASIADIEHVRAQYGLDQPLPTQFALWVEQLLQGNLGHRCSCSSPWRRPCWTGAEPTLFLAIFAVGIAALIGIPAGMAAAIWRGSAADQAFSSLAMLAPAFPASGWA